MPKRVDENQKAIVQALRTMGCKVVVTSDLGKGFPDLLVGVNKMVWLVEIKNGQLPPSAQKLTSAEERFHKEWKDFVVIINSVEKAIEFVNSKRTLYAN